MDYSSYLEENGKEMIEKSIKYKEIEEKWKYAKTSKNIDILIKLYPEFHYLNKEYSEPMKDELIKFMNDYLSDTGFFIKKEEKDVFSLGFGNQLLRYMDFSFLVRRTFDYIGLNAKDEEVKKYLNYCDIQIQKIEEWKKKKPLIWHIFYRKLKPKDYPFSLKKHELLPFYEKNKGKFEKEQAELKQAFQTVDAFVDKLEKLHFTIKKG